MNIVLIGTGIIALVLLIYLFYVLFNDENR